MIGSSVGRRGARRGGWKWLVAVLLVASARPALPQSALERTPNLGGAWIGRPGTVHFNFVHRFSLIGTADKVINVPSFLVAAGLPGRLLAGTVYASNSSVSPEVRPNEWEVFARWQALGAPTGEGTRLFLQAGYNTAAASVDGEVAATGEVGPLTVVGALRSFSRPYGAPGGRAALGAGAVWRLGPRIGLAADVASLLDRQAAERVAWSAGLLLALPHTPHTLSFHATNADPGTLQGLSRGGEEMRWGFEFTVPVTLRRYFGGAPAVAAKADQPPVAGGADTVVVAIEGLRYVPDRITVAPGTTVVWVNRDPVVHTVTGDDGRWGSGDLGAGARWSHTFADPGDYPLHCAPHPFMKATVSVGRRAQR